MLMEKLKAYLEENFEGVAINGEEDVLNVVEKLVTDYNEVFTQLQAMKFETVKEQKMKELEEAGIDKEVIEAELEGIEEISDLEEIADRLIRVATKVAESRKGAHGVDPLELKRKGSAFKKSSQKAEPTNAFDKLMKSI